jgi:hypothetical protein
MAILTESGWIGFKEGTEKVIITDFFDLIKKDQPKIDKMATENVKQAFGMFDKPVIDTGYTQKSTKAYSFWGKDRFVIRFITPNDRASGDGKMRGYAVFPLLGKSTSKKYGERNWLKKGAEKTFEKILNSNF